MEKILIKAGQKSIDPPLMVPDSGFMLPIKTAPASINFMEPGNEAKIEALPFTGDIKVGIELSDRKREMIKRAFFNDWLRMEKADKEMTAYETQDRREEKLRLLAPVLGRLQQEMLHPMLARSYELLHEAGKIPLAPRILQKRALVPVYVSPASRAQTGSRATDMGRFVQELMPLAQIDPGVMDAIDLDKYASELALARGTPRNILRTPKEIQAIRAQKQQAQQMQQMAQTAEPASKAVKNLADAAKQGGMAGGMQ